jgi:hypothetical protein
LYSDAWTAMPRKVSDRHNTLMGQTHAPATFTAFVTLNLPMNLLAYFVSRSKRPRHIHVISQGPIAWISHLDSIVIASLAKMIKAVSISVIPKMKECFGLFRYF